MNERFICDCCGEEFNIDYRCDKCSDEIITKLVQKYNPHWYGYTDSEEFIIAEEDFYTGNVCGNCCRCNQYPALKQAIKV